MEKLDFLTLIGVIFACFSLLSVILAAYDKLAAKRHKRRIPENTLILVGIFGGAALEYITMRVIHHKTLHKKFMIGLPMIFVLQVLAVSAAYFYLFG